MSVTQQQLDTAIEEFGNDAYKRFTNKGFLFDSNDELLREFVGYNDIEFKALPELAEHDIEVYVNKAKDMWQWRHNYDDFEELGYKKDLIFKPFANNQDLFDSLNSVNYIVERKTSAALPFNLERAKAGDVVEQKVLKKEGFGLEWVTMILPDSLGIEETQYTNYYKNPYIRKNGMKMIYA
jgi:hypothetical protein